jgi:signal transduction histidine kinase
MKMQRKSACYTRIVKRRTLRPQPLTLLVASMLVLLPVLAFFQYRWLGQLGDAEKERLQRNLSASTSELERRLELELIRTVIGLQLDSITLGERAWDDYAEKVKAWRSAALAPEVLADIWLVDEAGVTRPGLLLSRWDSKGAAFRDAAWPKQLTPIHTRLEADRRRVLDRSTPFLHRAADIVSPDGSFLVLPVMPGLPARSSDPVARPPIPRFAFTIIALDQKAIRQRMLPALVSRYLGPPDTSNFQVAIVSRGNSRDVLYESRPGDAGALLTHADIDAPLFGFRRESFSLIRRAAETLRAPGVRPPGEPPKDVLFGFRLRRFADGEQRPGGVEDAPRWRLLVRHRAGSLEAAVGRARQRNLALSFGLLVMMGVSVALIVVGARRAQRLGAQQVEFVAAVSHELRTPIAVIGSAADNLEQGVVTDSLRVREYGSAIRTEARRLAETVERVLEFAGIQAGRVMGPRDLVPAREVIDAALAAADPLIAEHRITLDCDLPRSLPTIAADRAALRSAIENLLGNAAKHGGFGGRVRVAAHVVEDAGRPELQIAVTDGGPGIPPSERSRIFEPFYRGSRALSRRIQGSGLGLSIVKSVIEAHGGRVSVTSAAGTGSTFTLHLPVEDEQPASLPALVTRGQRVEG